MKCQKIPWNSHEISIFDPQDFLVNESHRCCRGLSGHHWTHGRGLVRRPKLSLLRSSHLGHGKIHEVITGWPGSFVHQNIDFFSKLAACYMIQFPSFMCYAVTALRVLSQAPWTDHMFHGHIRELILFAIGNGWTWTDQSATVQHRRVSVSEVRAAIASYSNQTAFPPGQVADLDTAIIEVCDDLYPEHCEFFFPSISMGHGSTMAMLVITRG